LKDIPPLVEDLNNAGIRFVHFSEENEIKSQVSFVNCDQNSGQSRWEPQGYQTSSKFIQTSLNVLQSSGQTPFAKELYS
jgi:hypothetical protein